MLQFQKFFFGFSLLLLIFIFSACKSTPQINHLSESKIEITDDLDRKLQIPTNITRAVSLAPNLTEIVFAVGAGHKLVGVTDYCNFPAETKNIQKIGDTLKPNIENIIALKPQIVLVSTASQLESFTKTLEEKGIIVFVTNPASLDKIYQSIEKIGEIFSAEDQAERIVANLQDRVAKVEEKAENSDHPKVFVQIDKSLYTIGKDSFITDLIKLAAGISVTENLETPYPKLSKETAIALNPEIIILSESPGNTEPNEVFKNSAAVKNNKVFKIDADLLSRPSPRIVDGLEQLAAYLHQ